MKTQLTQDDKRDMLCVIANKISVSAKANQGKIPNNMIKQFLRMSVFLQETKKKRRQMREQLAVIDKKKADNIMQSIQAMNQQFTKIHDEDASKIHAARQNLMAYQNEINQML